ncbi:class I SAM-dependent methyltransferase [Halalkalibaculum sp. DA384]|uniref:class I SAM-dependent methyltransferase n=1 Tax=Halalkalibaculum sp. DA384 TaxID=3373606 RepID=UPI0037540FC5
MEPDTELRNKKIERYYRLHSSIYDWTRWSFLFGREELLNRIPELPPNPRILEIGCGTGTNLTNLEYLFPDALIYGMDLSGDMIRQARTKVDKSRQITLVNGAYGDNKFNFEPFNLILLSYSLSMLGSQAEQIMKQVHRDLTSDGYVAVVDFSDTRFSWFQRWMKLNHVAIDGQLTSLLNRLFIPRLTQHKKAYLGLWRYLLFIGRRRPSADI